MQSFAAAMRYTAYFLPFFFNDTATTEIYTLSLHDALPICFPQVPCRRPRRPSPRIFAMPPATRSLSPLAWRKSSARAFSASRSEEHTSQLQSHSDHVYRLLLEKKKYSERDGNRGL